MEQMIKYVVANTAGRTKQDGAGPRPLQAQEPPRLQGGRSMSVLQQWLCCTQQRPAGVGLSSSSSSIYMVLLVQSNVMLHVAFKGNIQCNKPTLR